jgi:hypothetical protein
VQTKELDHTTKKLRHQIKKTCTSVRTNFSKNLAHKTLTPTFQFQLETGAIAAGNTVAIKASESSPAALMTGEYLVWYGSSTVPICRTQLGTFG